MTEGSRPSPKSAMKVVMNSKAIMVTGVQTCALPIYFV